jgi:hypothetical protein
MSAVQACVHCPLQTKPGIVLGMRKGHKVTHRHHGHGQANEIACTELHIESRCTLGDGQKRLQTGTKGHQLTDHGTIV